MALEASTASVAQALGSASMTHMQPRDTRVLFYIGLVLVAGGSFLFAWVFFK